MKKLKRTTNRSTKRTTKQQVKRTKPLTSKKGVTVSALLDEVLYKDFLEFTMDQDRSIAWYIKFLMKRELADFGYRKYYKCD